MGFQLSPATTQQPVPAVTQEPVASPTVAPVLSIRTSLALAAAACILPAVLMGALLIAYDYRHERLRLIRDSVGTARALVAAVDTELAGATSALFALATSPYLVSGEFSAFHAQAKAALANQSFVALVLSDENGNQLVNTLRPYGDSLPTNLATPGWMKQMAVTGKPVITDLFVGHVARTYVVGIIVPVRIDGRIRYSLSGGITSEHLSRILVQQRLPPGWIGGIFDSTGTTVARTREAERFVGRKASALLAEKMHELSEDAFEHPTREGIDTLTVFSRSPISKWTVVIGIPTEQLKAELWYPIAWLSAASVALLGIGILIALRLGRHISQSIQGLAAPALALSGGAPVKVPRSSLKEAHELGSALERTWELLTEVQRRALTDPVTGLCNRAGFEDLLRRELEVGVTTERRLALLFIDLDGFKGVNDQHGHQVGDELLRAVARRLERSIRHAFDTPARLGGDEFAVALAGVTIEQATRVAEHIVTSLSEPYTIEDVALEVSASIGIAAYPESARTIHGLLDAADEAMYRAKKAGGRRSVVAQPAA